MRIEDVISNEWVEYRPYYDIYGKKYVETRIIVKAEEVEEESEELNTFLKNFKITKEV